MFTFFTKKPMNDFTISADGYICYRETTNLPKPGLLWVLGAPGWMAFINNGEHTLRNLILSTGAHTVPTNDQIADAIGIFVKRMS